MDTAAIIGLVIAPLVVAGVGGLAKIAFHGVENHLKQQDVSILALQSRLHDIELNLAELVGTLRGRRVQRATEKKKR